MDSDQTTGENAAKVFLDLEHLVKEHISRIAARKSDLKTQKEMLASALSNDETYRTHEEEAKKAAKQKTATKTQILSLPANASLNEKVRDLATEIKELDVALSDYLREYQRMSGSTEIESNDGQEYEIVYTAKLVKKSSRPR